MYFRLDIKPAVDLTKIALIDFEPEAFVDCINDFTVDTSGLPPDQRSDIQCDIAGPDGSPVDSFVNKMGPDGPYQVSEVTIHFRMNLKWGWMVNFTLSVAKWLISVFFFH